MRIPIIFLHRTVEEHVPYCLQQAKLSNLTSRVILLGTAENQSMCNESIEHYLIKDYCEHALEFEKIYKHVSHNPYIYNLFCFQRWFILRDFMKQNKIPRCCALDSDVLLYTSVDTPDFYEFSMEFSWTTFCTIEMLEAFCSYIILLFSEPKQFSRVLSFAEKQGDAPVSDMIFCDLFHHDHPEFPKSFGIFSNCFFDHNLNCPIPLPLTQVELWDGRKKIYLLNNQLYCKKVGSDDLLRVCSLHFQSSAKLFLKHFFSPVFSTHSAHGSSSPLFFDYLTCRWVPCDP